MPVRTKTTAALGVKTPTAALSRAPDPENDDDELADALPPSLDELDFELVLELDAELRSESACDLDEFHLRSARVVVRLQLLEHGGLTQARVAREADARVRS